MVLITFVTVLPAFFFFFFFSLLELYKVNTWVSRHAPR